MSIFDRKRRRPRRRKPTRSAPLFDRLGDPKATDVPLVLGDLAQGFKTEDGQAALAAMKKKLKEGA